MPSLIDNYNDTTSLFGGYRVKAIVGHIITISLSFLIALGVLLHSRYINMSKYGSVRICTEVSAAFILVGCIVMVVSMIFSQSSYAVFISCLFNLNIVGIVVSLCDMYMFYDRYAFVQRLSSCFKASILLYFFFSLVGILLILFSAFTAKKRLFSLLYYIIITGGVMYYIFFSVLLMRKLANGYRLLSRLKSLVQTNKIFLIQIIVVKSLGHLVFSLSKFGLALYANVSKSNIISNPLIYNILILLGMHIWFNSKIEKYIDVHRFLYIPHNLNRVVDSGAFEDAESSMNVTIHHGTLGFTLLVRNHPINIDGLYEDEFLHYDDSEERHIRAVHPSSPNTAVLES